MRGAEWACGADAVMKPSPRRTGLADVVAADKLTRPLTAIPVRSTPPPVTLARPRPFQPYWAPRASCVFPFALTSAAHASPASTTSFLSLLTTSRYPPLPPHDPQRLHAAPHPERAPVVICPVSSFPLFSRGPAAVCTCPPSPLPPPSRPADHLFAKSPALAMHRLIWTFKQTTSSAPQ